MSELGRLFEAAQVLRTEFVAACRAAGFPHEWAAYRADARGEVWPPELSKAHDAYVAATHAFYGLRDGPKGFLGGRGL